MNKRKLKTIVRGLIDSEGELTQKAVGGGLWVFLSFGIEKILGLIRTVILARLLLPTDFGIMGIAMVAIGAIESFTNFGIDPAIIHRKDCDQKVQDTAWMIAILRGLFLGILLFLTSPFIAHFYKTPELKSILRVISFYFFFDGFKSVGLILLRKELNFKARSFFNITTSFLNAAVAITLAFILRNVWALVISTVTASVISLIISYLVHPFRPKFHFEMKTARSLFGFGKYIMATGILAFLNGQGDDALVGKVLNMHLLGLYTMAWYISNLPSSIIRHIIGVISLPAFSRVQDDIPALRRGCLKTLRLASLISFPMAGGMAMVAVDLTEVLLGHKWLPMVTVLQILCLFGLIRCFDNAMGAVIYSVGRPNLGLRATFIQFISMAAIIYPLTIKYNIIGAGIAVVIAFFICIIYISIKTIQIIQCKLYDFLMELFIPSVSTIFMCLQLYLIKYYIFENRHDITSLVVLILMGIFLYVLNTLIMDRLFNFGIINFIREKLEIINRS